MAFCKTNLTIELKPKFLVRVAKEWSNTEAGRKVQESWGCFHEWRKARQRTEYLNWKGLRSNRSFALNSFCKHSHFGTDRKSATTCASVRNEVFTKNQCVTLLNKMRSFEIRKPLNIEPLLLRIKRFELRWFGHVSRMPLERLPKQALLAKANGRRPVGRPRIR